MKKIWRKIRNYFKALLAAQDTDRRPADDSSTPAAATVADGGSGSPPKTPAGVDFSLLDWRYGGFKGAGAALSGRARIKSLNVSLKGLSYEWAEGGCEDLDRACSHDNPCCTCALFCRVDGKWVGGKFDHISTDRRTRGFENIEERYGGWEPESLSRATAFAFVILDDGGRRRTNTIVQEGGV